MNTPIVKPACLILLLALWAMPGVAEPVWIDVRSAAEHVVDHIDGDRRVSHDEIVPAAAELFPDKDTPIYLYCRSGGRAGRAQAALQQAGYTQVFNAGGIDDARKARGLSESD